MAAAMAATALALNGGELASAQHESADESAASAAWKTAALASTPATSSDAKPSPAASAPVNAGVTPPADDAPIAEIPMPPSTPRASAPASANHLKKTGASNLVPTPSDANDAPNLSEIPSVSGGLPDEPSASTTGSQPSTELNEVTRYEQEQSGMPPEQLKSLQEYDSGSEIITSSGMQLREDRRTLNSGEEADGLLVVGVRKGSPAEEAGLHAYNAAGHQMITGVAMAAAMFFPPALVLVPAIDYSSIGESYDLIIGVDGARVRNFLDYQDRTRDTQPGEMIYLSVVRDGKRLQITVPVPPGPPNLTQATN